MESTKRHRTMETPRPKTLVWWCGHYTNRFLRGLAQNCVPGKSPAYRDRILRCFEERTETPPPYTHKWPAPDNVPCQKGHPNGYG
eukprot:4384905-Karenia_brevis.AAC.1